MTSIEIKMKDGTVKKFREVGRSGGSWTISVAFENGWVVVTDEYGSKTAYPSSDVAEVTTENARGCW